MADLDEFIEAALADGKGWSEDERRAYLSSIDDEAHPFFAEDPSKVDPVLMEAMRQLTYEGETDETLAEHFHSEGNERFKRAKLNKMYFQHAALFYTEAIKHAVMADQTPDMIKRRATSLANRAAANLGAGNFGSVKRDCDESLRLVPNNVKCYYRKAKAFESLKQYREAVATAVEGLALDAGNKELEELKVRCQEQVVILEKKAAQDAASLAKQQAEVASLYKECRARGIQLGPRIFEAGHRHWGDDFGPRVVEQEDAEEKEMLWPLLLLYPASHQSDVINTVGEGDLLSDHLDIIFPDDAPPAPWDTAGEYRKLNVEVYLQLNAVLPFKDEKDCIEDFMQTKALRGEMSAEAAELAAQKQSKKNKGAISASWVHINPASPLLAILRCKGHVVPGGIPTLHVYPKGSQALQSFLKLWQPKEADLEQVETYT